MPSFLLPLKTSQAAVIIGLVDIAVCELFKYSASICTRWQLRARLHTKHYFVLPATCYISRTSPIFTTPSIKTTRNLVVLAAQVLILLTAVFLELSITPATFPSHREVQTACYETAEWTRAIGKTGPKITELQDDRIPPYVRQVGCPDSILSASVAGAYALTRGYPYCLSPFKERAVDDTLILQGSAIAHVANTEAGDPYLAYAVAPSSSFNTSANGVDARFDDGNEIDAKTMQPSTFASIFLEDSNRSTAFWTFGDQKERQRVIANIQIPLELMSDGKGLSDDNPYGNSNSASVNCTQNDIKCFRAYADAAHSRPIPVLKSYFKRGAAVYIVSRKRKRSSICMFEKSVDFEVAWVFMRQHIPSDNDRPGRDGPTPVYLRIRGNALCIDDLKPQQARLYLDGMGEVALNSAMEHFKQNGAPVRECVRDIMQTAAVMVGLKVEDGPKCAVRDVYKGSALGEVETVIASVVTVLALVCVIVLMVFGYKYRKECPIEYDPLHVPSVIARALGESPLPLQARRQRRNEESKMSKEGISIQESITPDCSWVCGMGRLMRSVFKGGSFDGSENNQRRVWVQFSAGQKDPVGYGAKGNGSSQEIDGVPISEEMAAMPYEKQREILEADEVQKPKKETVAYMMSVTHADDGRLELNIAVP